MAEGEGGGDGADVIQVAFFDIPLIAQLIIAPDEVDLGVVILLGQLHVLFGHDNFDVGHFDFNPVFLGRLEAVFQVMFKGAEILNVFELHG